MYRALLVAATMVLAGCVVTSPDGAQRAGSEASPPEGCGVTAAGLPDLCDNDLWFNSDGEDLDSLAANDTVVLLDFWTYSCINCIRTLPHLTALHDTYAPYGFTIIGIHVPEFDFEKEPANIEYAIDKHGIHYPVVVDNDRIIARNFEFRYWPTHHLLGPDGALVDTHIGEGAYEETEQMVRDLLMAQGAELPPPIEPLEDVGAYHQGATPELYAGTWRQDWTIGNPEGYSPGDIVAYTADGAESPDKLFLDGRWFNGEEALQAAGPGSIYLDFTAGAVNFVIGIDEPACLPVFLDGDAVPEGRRGGDVVERDGGTCVEVAGQDSFDLYAGPFGSHEIRIDVVAGLELYTFAFGSRSS